jgi:hypothetical protein
MVNLIYSNFSSRFKGKYLLTKADITRFFREYEPGLKDATITWRIFDLRNKGIITDLKKGMYQLNNKSHFLPVPDNNITNIANLIKREYDPQFYTIWDTIHLNEFTELQVVNASIVLEVEKGFTDSVFFSLRREGVLNVFTKLNEQLVELYVTSAERPVIIKSFLGRAPIQQINNIVVPKLEKVLVDLYCDNDVYYPWQGGQLRQIYKNATTRYNLNFTKMFNYAKRRHRLAEIRQILLEVVPDELITIIE